MPVNLQRLSTVFQLVPTYDSQYIKNTFISQKEIEINSFMIIFFSVHLTKIFRNRKDGFENL